ncbi:MAG: hypothetical protein AB8H79_08065 [Myxococcota bacterium]
MRLKVSSLGMFSLLLFGCDAPQPEDEVVVTLDHYAYTGPERGAYWDPLVLRPFTETTMGSIERGGERLEIQDQQEVSPARVHWWMSGPGGRELDLFPVAWPDSPGHGRYMADPFPDPGLWRVVGEVDGIEKVRNEYVVTEHGTAPLDQALEPEGAYFLVEDGLSEGGPGQMLGIVANAGLGPIVVRVRPGGIAGTFDVQAFAGGESEPCKALFVPMTAPDEAARLSATGDYTASQGVPVTLSEGAIEFGLHPDGQSLAGLRIVGELDIRDLDSLVNVPGEPADPVAAKDLVEGSGAVLQLCSDGTKNCLSVWIHSGTGTRVTEAEALDVFGKRGTWTDFEPAGECAGMEEGSLSFRGACSVVGSAGLGVWFLGLGTLLFRRRRGEA